MISADEAVRVARGYLGEDAEIGIEEFDLGYVAWRVTPPPADPTRPLPTTGQPTVVVDKETGELTKYGSLPTTTVAQQYTVERAAFRRFPPDVRAILERARWWPGRDKSAAVDAWLARIAEDVAGLEASGAARAALAEFGGLALARFGSEEAADGGIAIRLFPAEGRPATERVHGFTARTGIPVFPIGVYDDGSADLVIDPAGQVFMLHRTDDFFVGGTIDEALVWLVHGNNELPVVYNDGTWGPAA